MSSPWNPWSRRDETDRIFISYRRSDTSGFAGRLEDTLKAYFGKRRVFRDVGAIEPGADFLEETVKSLQTTAVLVVLIGPDWLVAGDDGTPRLHAPDDYVANEIKPALGGDCLVVPVLVDGATMPTEDELPEGLKDLTRRNAVTISDEHWSTDVTRLAKVLSFDVARTVGERKVGVLKVAALMLVSSAMVISLLLYVQLSHEQYNVFVMAMNPLAMVIAVMMLAATASWFERSRRKYVWAAVVLSTLGITIPLFRYLHAARFEYDVPLDDVQAPIAFLYTSIVGVVMLVLLGMSGFKPNDELS